MKPICEFSEKEINPKSEFYFWVNKGKDMVSGVNSYFNIKEVTTPSNKKNIIDIFFPECFCDNIDELEFRFAYKKYTEDLFKLRNEKINYPERYLDILKNYDLLYLMPTPADGDIGFYEFIERFDLDLVKVSEKEINDFFSLKESIKNINPEKLNVQINEKKLSKITDEVLEELFSDTSPVKSKYEILQENKNKTLHLMWKFKKLKECYTFDNFHEKFLNFWVTNKQYFNRNLNILASPGSFYQTTLELQDLISKTFNWPLNRRKQVWPRLIMATRIVFLLFEKHDNLIII